MAKPEKFVPDLGGRGAHPSDAHDKFAFEPEGAQPFPVFGKGGPGEAPLYP